MNDNQEFEDIELKTIIHCFKSFFGKDYEKNITLFQQIPFPSFMVAIFLLYKKQFQSLSSIEEMIINEALQENYECVQKIVKIYEGSSELTNLKSSENEQPTKDNLT